MAKTSKKRAARKVSAAAPKRAPKKTRPAKRSKPAKNSRAAAKGATNTGAKRAVRALAASWTVRCKTESRTYGPYSYEDALAKRRECTDSGHVAKVIGSQ